MRIFKWKKLLSLMMVGVFCGGAVGVSVFADDDGKGQPPARPAPEASIEAPAHLTERERLLLERVEQLEKQLAEVKQLEKRIADLEGKAQPVAAASAPTPAGSDSSSASTGTGGAGPAAALGGGLAEPVSPGVIKTATAGAVRPQAMDTNATGTVQVDKALPLAFADFHRLDCNPR